MKRSVIEYRLRLEMRNMAPDKLDELLAACGEDCPSPATVIHPRFNWRKLVSVAALIVLVLCSVITDSSLKRENCVLTVDVNPSFELRVNGYGRIKEAVILNSDAEELFGETKLTGQKLGKALTAAIDELCENGYLSADSNGMLISVNELRSKHPDRLCDRVIASVNDAAEDEGFKCAVLYQTLSGSVGTPEYENVSVGKAALAEKLDPSVDGFSAQELAELGIHELLFLASGLDTLPDDLRFFGTLSGFIDRAGAEMIAVAAAAGETSDGDPSLVRYGDGLAYKVSVSSGSRNAVYLISALTGDILEIIDSTLSDPDIIPQHEDTQSPGSYSRTLSPLEVLDAFIRLNGNLVLNIADILDDLSVSETVSDGAAGYVISFTVDGESQSYFLPGSAIDKIG